MIKNFAQNDQVDFYGLIKSSATKETKTGKTYLALEISDKTGNISGNVWDATPDQIDTLVEGIVVHITGKISSYQGKNQLDFQTIETSDHNPIEFIESAPVDLVKVYEYIQNYIDNIENKNWQTVTKSLYQKYLDAFKEYPAATRVHHAYYGGLAFHTSTMLLKSESLCKFYPWLNKELIGVGILLHDLGKTIEMPGVTGSDYTTEGELLGHIEIILEEIVEICVQEGIDHRAEDMLLLKHVIASHHGKLEWGTIAAPRIAEAAMIHMIDKMDAEMEQYRKIYETLPKGEWTPSKEFFLGNTRVYRPNL